MIVTFTPNPSLDRTASLAEPLTRGEVHRLSNLTAEPGGKGVNVARVIHLAGQPTVAVVPADEHDPLIVGLDKLGVPFRAVGIGAPVRANLTITEDDGTTTKLNEPGPELSADQVAQLEDTLLAASQGADWVILSGSLPPGAPGDWYARLVDLLRDTGARIAVDTSDAPLMALAGALPGAAPHVIKPNSDELGQLCGTDGRALEEAANNGMYGPILAAARSLTDQGIEAVLITLGGAGALLVTAEGAWRAAAPRITVRSTVGAGDSSLAGYVLAAVAGAEPADRLRNAIAFGSGAAALAGSALPRPDQTNPDAVSVEQL